jgi:hypothetical protein
VVFCKDNQNTPGTGGEQRMHRTADMFPRFLK